MRTKTVFLPRIDTKTVLWTEVQKVCTEHEAQGFGVKILLPVDGGFFIVFEGIANVPIGPGYPPAWYSTSTSQTPPTTTSSTGGTSITTIPMN